MGWRSRMLAGILTMAVIVSACPAGILRVEAEDEVQTLTEEQIREQEMAAAYAIPAESNSYKNWPQAPAIYGESGIVMDIKSGTVLYAKGIDAQRYPASITKIMTALVALENGDLENDKVTFTQESVDFLEYGDAHIGMTPGEVLSLKDAMYAMMLASANEVSYAIAESIGNKMGIGYQGFIDLMNTRAKELGCTGTHFVNANGLHDDSHYITAHDMAVISAELYKHSEIVPIMQTLSYTIAPTNLVAEERVFQQKHKMLYPGNQYYYQYCTGGKTGYTDQSKTTLVTYADNGDMQLVCVILKSHGAVTYEDTANLFEYAYQNFKGINISNLAAVKELGTVDPDTCAVVPSTSDTLSFDVVVDQKDKTQGTLVITSGGNPAGQARIKLSDEYIKKEGLDGDSKTVESGKVLSGNSENESFQEKVVGSVVSFDRIMAILLIIIVLLAGILVIYVRRTKLKQKKQRQIRIKNEQKKRKRMRQSDKKRMN